MSNIPFKILKSVTNRLKHTADVMYQMEGNTKKHLQNLSWQHNSDFFEFFSDKNIHFFLSFCRRQKYF